MKMSKTSAMLLFVLLALLLSACSDPTKSDYKLPNHLGGSVAASGGPVIETLDDLIEHSDHIVYGQLLSSSPFKGSMSEYRFQVNREMKGRTNNKEISVFSMTPLEEAKGQYMLFLIRNDSEYLAEPNYAVLGDPGLSDGEQIMSDPLQGKSVKQLMKEIDNSPKLKVARASFASPRRIALLLRSISLAS